MSTTPLMHPALADLLHKQRHTELVREASRFRLVASLKRKPTAPAAVRVTRREGKVTWIDTVQVNRPA
jgi:hypothetical protein